MASCFWILGENLSVILMCYMLHMPSNKHKHTHFNPSNCYDTTPRRAKEHKMTSVSTPNPRTPPLTHRPLNTIRYDPLRCLSELAVYTTRQMCRT